MFFTMVREKDVCWEYAERLEGNKVRCKFCDRILNGGISRLKHHLSRLPSKGVNPCTKVRDDVTERVREIIATKDDVKETLLIKRQKVPHQAKSVSSNGKAPPIIVESIPKVFSSITSLTSSPGNDEIGERSVALFFFENNLDFRVARSSSYRQMLDAVRKCGNGFLPPSADSLKTTWLERIKSEVNSQSKEAEREWALTGCTVVAEKWTDNKSRALINFLVSSPTRSFFHRSVDVSLYYKNTKYLSDLFDSVVQDLGQENVVQIIMDDNLNCPALANHIQQNYGPVFVTPCAARCMNAILDDFCRVDWINRCILQAQAITKYVYNNSPVLDAMKKATAGQDIIRSGITKPVSNFLTLQSMLRQKSRLKHMFGSPEYSIVANKTQIATCVAILEDNGFWHAVEECVAVSEPFLKVMREVSGGRPAVGFVYEMMTRAKESIRTYYIMDEIKCKTFLDIVDTKWKNSLHSPLHSAAAFLNPSIQYNPEIKFLGSIKEEFYRVLEKLLPTPELRRDITSQILLFTRGSGMFGCNLAKEAIDTVSPGIWWEQFGDAAPTLQRVAIQILSQVCSSSFTTEKQWSALQQIHSEKHNRIDKEMLNDLLYVNYNLRLERSLKMNGSEIDPLQLDDIDMSSEWVEETETQPPVQWLDRFGSALEGGDLNVRQFNAAIFGAGDHLFNL
ncbi:uncharacterized protein LOC127256154 [Andrographis paniculata]|uniref:uncharacterized protein LOC127256154 n=1 Tax=Andrographis paniculata TaxID=175694 RepID=UPI0021E83F4A|nr:uncharacterized protein LOC127256154 [Andrographis paniculata]XP_051137960.1 uncharacterized protein LOC127256154 [Andrographis paniculata]